MHNTERIIALMIMLGGVAFFSYIMGSFIEIISNYEKKMGVVEKSGDLHNWLIMLTRYTNNQPLPRSITTQIEQNFSYFWTHDRLQCVKNDEAYLQALPQKIKNQIMIGYLFSDIFKTFKKFFNVESVKDSTFLYDLAFGFMPRQFSTDEDDRLIYDEEEEVPEMYFFTEGQVGIGFCLVANGMINKPYSIAKKLPAPNVICDHYVFSKCKSQFIYMAMKEIKGFALAKKFIHEFVEPKHPLLFEKIQNDCFRTYKKTIFKPISEQRKVEIGTMNKKSVYRYLEFQDIKDRENNADKSPINKMKCDKLTDTLQKSDKVEQFDIN